jgi:hypothetical protein
MKEGFAKLKLALISVVCFTLVVRAYAQTDLEKFLLQTACAPGSVKGDTCQKALNYHGGAAFLHLGNGELE